MNTANDDEKRLLRQLFLIRYTSLLKQIQAKFTLSDTIAEELKTTLLRIDWIDQQLR